MGKFYITDGNNTFIINSEDHLQACFQALQRWQTTDKSIGKYICFSNKGFNNIPSYNCIETYLIRSMVKNK